MAVYRYETKFRLTNPVNDKEAAQEYLSEDDMTEYLKDYIDRHDKTKSEKLGLSSSDVINIEWLLQTEQSGKIVLVTNKELSHEVLNSISEWVSGQNSDGLGEGFEQQDFATICDVDEWGDTDWDTCEMASFDWETNNYMFKLVSTNESILHDKDNIGSVYSENNFNDGKLKRHRIKEASKLENSVLSCHFIFDDELNNYKYVNTKKWLKGLELGGWIQNLKIFDKYNIKSESIDAITPTGFEFRVFTKLDLTIINDSYLYDIEQAVEKYVFDEIEPYYQNQPFGQEVIKHKIYARPNEKQIETESKRRPKASNKRAMNDIMKTIREARKVIKKANMVVEANNPTERDPLKIDAPRGAYWVWFSGDEIYGSVEKPDPTKNIVNARSITNFTSQGFENLQEVIDYVNKYF